MSIAALGKFLPFGAGSSKSASCSAQDLDGFPFAIIAKK